MIRYQRESWWTQVFIYRGGVLVLVWKGLVAYILYTSSLYVFMIYTGSHGTVVSDEGRSIHFLGGFVSFLLIWRLNQCYTRYELGKEFTSVYFSHLASLMGVGCGYIKGADLNSVPATQGTNSALSPEQRDKFEHIGIAMKVHIVRLTIAISVAFKYHCRIAENSNSGEPLSEEQIPGILFDLLRLKGLLYPEEHGMIDRACGLYIDEKRGQDKIFANNRSGAKPKLNRSETVQRTKSFSDAENKASPLPVVLLQMMRDVVAQPLSQQWGYPERVMNVLEIHICQIALAFEQLDRLITIPLPLAYLQHLLADEMENPIGDDDLDLNIMRMIHDLENRGGQIFKVSQTSRMRTRTALLAPLEDINPDFTPHDQGRTMGLTDIAFKQLRETGSFDFHFSWVAFPPHILAYCGEKEAGMAQAELLRMSSQFQQEPKERSSCCDSSCCCSCCVNKTPRADDETVPNSTRPLILTADATDLTPRNSTFDYQGNDLAEEAEELKLITHFLCVSRQNEATQAACDQLTKNLFTRASDHEQKTSRNSTLIQISVDERGGS